MTIRSTPVALALLAVLGLASCQTFDKEGTKPLVAISSPADPTAMRGAVADVFGREGFTVVSQDGDPMVFSRPARATDRIFYQDLDGNDLVNRTSVWIESSASGCEVRLTAQILHRPGTIFEDPRYPIVGVRHFYRQLLQKASLQAQGRPQP